MGRSRTTQRVNLKAVIATAVVVVVLVGGGFLATNVVQGRVRNELLKQADALVEQGQTRMALRHLEQYLRRKPDDLPVLDRYARLLSEAVLSPEWGIDWGRLNRGIAVNDRLIRLDPDGRAAGVEPTDRERNLRWLIEMMILRSAANRAGLDSRDFGELGAEIRAQQDLYRAAETLAERLIDQAKPRGTDDAEAYRLLAMAREGNAPSRGPRAAFEQAIASYTTALERDPADEVSADRLARIFRDKLDPPDPEAADRVLDALIAADPQSYKAWLVRHVFYADGADARRASEALARAAELAPDQPEVVLAGAEDALARRRPEEARRLLDRLGDGVAVGRVARLRADLDLAEGRTEEALARLREAMNLTQGTDAELAWRQATLLIDLGRLDEARPLIGRYKAIGPAANSDYLDGLMFQRQGAHGRAIASFNAAEQKMLNASLEPAMLVARASSKLVQGDRDGGIKDLERACDLAPRYAAARVALAQARLREGIEPAMAELRRGIAEAPDSLELRRAQLALLLQEQAQRPAGRRSWAAFDAALADARTNEAIGDPPSLVALEVRRLALDGQLDAALDRIERAVAAAPDSADLWLLWSDLLISRATRERPPVRADLEAAVAVLERASAPEAAGRLAAFDVRRAQLLAQLGRGGEATALLADAAATLPVDQRPAALQALGRMQIARGQFGEARAAYTAWKRLRTGSPEPLLALLEIAIDTGDIPGAEQALAELKGNAEDPGEPYRLGLAEFLIRVPGDDPLGDARKALAQVDAILEASPNSAPARLLRGMANLRIGELQTQDPEASEAAYTRALADLRAARDQGESRATPLLIDLLARLDRVEEIERLGSGGPAEEIDRLAAEALLRHGRAERAVEFVERAGTAPSVDPARYAAWRLAMFDRLGRTAQVEQSLRAQAEASRDPDPWLTLIRYLAARGRRDAAERAIADMKLAVDSRLPAELIEAEAFRAIGDLDAAERAFEAAVAARPDDREVLLVASRFDREAGRPERALERAERAVAADPSWRPATLWKALLMAEAAGDDPEAWQAAWDALGPEPADGAAQPPQERLARAVVLAQHPDPARREQAVGRLEALVGDQPASDPMTASARETLARLLLQQGRAERAAEVAAVTAIAGNNPADVALYVRALIDARRLDEAARQLERLRNLAPGSDSLAALDLLLVEARAEAGELAEQLERAYLAAADSADARTRAAITFRRLVQLGDSAAEPTARVGRDLAGRFPELAWMPAQWAAGREAFGDALELAAPAIDSDSPEAAFEAARAVLTVADRSKTDPELMGRVAELIERAAARHDLPGTTAILAMLRHLQGRSDPARFDDEIRIYRELLQSNPDDVVFLNNLAWALSEHANQPDEALELIDRALGSVGGRLPELIDTRGVILLRLGRLDEALAAFEQVVGDRPNSPVYHFHLARALHAAGRDDEARASMARALELGLTTDDLDPFEHDAFDALKAL